MQAETKRPFMIYTYEDGDVELYGIAYTQEDAQFKVEELKKIDELRNCDFKIKQQIYNPTPVEEWGEW